MRIALAEKNHMALPSWNLFTLPSAYRKPKGMAKNTGVLICLLIMAMDIVTSILGIEAEVAQNKVSQELN